MKRSRLFTTICLMAAALFTACTQDELSSPSEGVEGAYPLQIGSVTMSVESSEQPWTRVSESSDGQSSVWTGGEEFYVKFEGSDEVGTYRITDAATGTVEAVKPIYWKSTQPANIIAWYTKPQLNAYNWMDLSGQENGLAYVLRATADNASYNTPISLNFEHQLAKVRVVTKGTADVTDINLVNVPTNCYIEEGRITEQENIQFRIYMLRVEREGIGTCWEANVVPGVELKSFDIFIRLDGGMIDQICELSPSVTTQAGALHTITWTVHNGGTTTIDLSNGDYTINGGGTYYFTGTANHAIRVTGGNPEIYLEDVKISVSSGPAIDITNGNPTIHVKGNDNEVSSNNGAGIYVAENSTVTITGNGRDNVLTAQGAGGGSGIGGYVISNNNGAACGNINISNVTVYSYGSRNNAGDISAGIGSASGASCGTITIDNATVHAYGTSDRNNMQYTPGIGCGYPYSGSPTSIPVVNISNQSVIHAHRGGVNTDYIGWTGNRWNSTDANSTINLGGGTCTGSTIYCYTGTSSTTDKVVKYDGSGNGTEQSQ